MAQTAVSPEVNSGHLEVIHKFGESGIPWSQLWGWIVKYGWPIVAQVLAVLLPVLIGHKKIDTGKLVAWIESALAALATGGQIPPLPTL